MLPSRNRIFYKAIDYTILSEAGLWTIIIQVGKVKHDIWQFIIWLSKNFIYQEINIMSSIDFGHYSVKIKITLIKTALTNSFESIYKRYDGNKASFSSPCFSIIVLLCFQISLSFYVLYIFNFCPYWQDLALNELNAIIPNYITYQTLWLLWDL